MNCLHACCAPIVVQVPGLQGTGIVWENCTEEEKKEITDRILDPVKDYADKAEESANKTEELANKTEELFNNSLAVSGNTCYEESWYTSAAIDSGTEISIPSGRQYVVGKYQLRVSYNGYVLSLGYGFSEVGTSGNLSSKFKILFAVEKGSHITIRFETLSKEVVDEAAQAYANKAGEYAAQALQSKNDTIKVQSQTVATISSEGDYQIKRIKGEVDNTLVVNGVGGNEKFWTVTKDTSAGTEIVIPGTLQYVVGRHHFHVSWNGLELYIGQNFEEVGDEDTSSNKFKLTFNIKTGDELDVKTYALGNGDVADALSLAGEASSAVAELSRKVVYKEES